MALDVSKAIEIIKNASDEDMTAIEKVLKEETVTEKNAKVLEILKRVDPERYRDLLTLVEIEGELPHVKPGDLITSTLINALIDRIVYSSGRDDLVAGLIAHGHRHARALQDESELARLVKEQARPGDMVVCLGAGTISAWANALPGRLVGQAA